MFFKRRRFMRLYQKTREQVEKEFKTNITTGLTNNEVKKRLKKCGLNTLPDVERETWLAIFIRQFQSPLIYILLFAAAIIFFVGEDKIDAFVISGVLIFNAIIGTIQEGRTRNILESLKQFIQADTIVIRDGKKELVQDIDLVPGDIILIQEGQRVPADARIVESNNIRVDEAVLTGESLAVRKIEDPLEDVVELPERRNMLFKGTYVLSGSGRAIVVATGLQTRIGKIHTTIEEISTEIPLAKEIERLSYWILIFIFVLCVFLFVIGFLTGRPLQELLIMLTALFICVVPEGLPVVLTLVLVSGVYRMARHNVLVKNMQAVEALGRADVIVTDKTGTLTRNEMMITKVIANGNVYQVTGSGYHTEGDFFLDGKEVDPKTDTTLEAMGTAAALLNSTEITYLPEQNLFDIKGSPTEAAMYVLAQKMGYTTEKLEQKYEKIYEIPFDSRLQYHAGFFKKDGKGYVFVTGSPEVVENRSTTPHPKAQELLTQLLADGLRMVAVAHKEFDIKDIPDNASEDKKVEFFKNLVDRSLKFLGFFAMQDAIRPEVRDIIRQARDAGIYVVMATGDHQKTAVYIAKEVGIYNLGDGAIDGSELNAMSDEELERRLDSTTVFSRVSPDHKLRIIRAFHKKGNIVAMTGDGINDAPSLVAADLGIAMGNIGTEVAKQAADIILLNDSFVNIIHAVEQGRHIFYTLQRVILYFFATNMGEILIVLFALILNLPLPITAVQILWLNLVTDGFLDIALSMEPQEPGLLSPEWLKQKPQLVDASTLFKMMFMSIPMALGGLWVFWHYYTINLAYARTMTLITLAMFQWFNAWNCRSMTRSIFQLGLFTNKWLILATAFVLGLQFFILNVPFMQHIFKTVPLSLHDWLVIFAVSSPILLLEELRKFFVRRFNRYAH